MDQEERVLTEIISDLIRGGMIVVSGFAGGLILTPVLGPELTACVLASAGLLYSFSERSWTWTQLWEVMTWRNVTSLIYKVAKTLFLENLNLLVKIAVRFAKFIMSLFNRNNPQAASRYALEADKKED